ncbi:MAG: efflux RND transporter periplasmic adaptor subunit [Hyphomicrobium sp.]
MKRIALTSLVLAALAAAGTGGYWAGHASIPLPGLRVLSAATISAKPEPATSGPIIYYKDPDGAPIYSATPRRTTDGREFRAVRASEDISFEDKTLAAAKEPETIGARRVLYYRNPMGLPDTSPVPKKDSMGMDYIPVYEGEDDSGTTVKVSPGKLQRTGVRFETAQRRIVTHPVRVPGVVQLDERRVTLVSTRSDAFIDKVENVTTGDRVRKGQPLLQLYSPDIVSAAAQLTANPGYDGSRRRLENLNVPAEVIAEIERTRKVPLTIGWSSPRDGLVLERNAIEGMKAPAGQILFRIADVSTVWVLADVPEHALGSIKVGQSAVVRVRSLSGQTFSGNINLIYPQVSKETRTTRVRIELSNPDGELFPDMYADVEIATGATTPVLAVDDSALIDTGTRQLVILDRGEGRFEPRDVKIGARGEGAVEIREGIVEGDRVVVAANFLIDAESNLKAALRNMTAPEAQP